MGGFEAEGLARTLKADGIRVNLLVIVDAAAGVASTPLYITDNVKTAVNYYQTSRSNFPVFSRGYPAQTEDDKKTSIFQYNMDNKTEKSGADAHGSMDESTQQSAENFMKCEMVGALDNIVKDVKTTTDQKSGGN